jgi:hypothetical protein
MRWWRKLKNQNPPESERLVVTVEPFIDPAGIERVGALTSRFKQRQKILPGVV